MADLFPRTTVGGVSMPRMIMGINWLLGWSHTGAAADAGIREKYQKLGCSQPCKSPDDRNMSVGQNDR